MTTATPTMSETMVPVLDRRCSRLRRAKMAPAAQAMAAVSAKRMPSIFSSRVAG